MRLYHSLDEVPERDGADRCVAIGFFDGVHRGHQQIIDRAVGAAAERGALSLVLTFDPHPNAVLHPEGAPRVLTPLELKAELVAARGVQELLVIPFDLEFSRLSPEDFCGLVLSERLAARSVMVGQNFHFGFRGAGTPETLAGYGRAHGFSVEILGLVARRGGAISSTRIRRLVSQGEVEEAAELLGHPHVLIGAVVGGAGRGRDLGMPTANLALEPPDVVVPAPGVYVTRSRFGTGDPGGQGRRSVTSVGTNPTFETDGVLRVETHVLDFQEAVYGQAMSVEFLTRLRGQRTFGRVEELVAQMRADLAAAREYFAREADGRV
jgi:riboflavin kinase/FMN adenylyltransferase